jgi:hypothetical protein
MRRTAADFETNEPQEIPGGAASHDMPEKSLRIRPNLSAVLWIVLPATAVAARIALGLQRLELAPTDPDHYIAFAQSLWSGEGFVFEGRPTAYRPPLYPILMAPLVGWLGSGRTFHAGLLIAQSLLGGATTWLAMRAAARIAGSVTSDNRAALTAASVAGAITALDPVLLGQAPLVMTETLAAFLLSGAVNAAVHDRFVRSGLWFGASALCRPSLLASLVLTAAVRLIPDGSSPPRRRLIQSLALVLCCWVVLLPWGLRNWQHFGEPVWTTTHGGYTLALANNAVYYDEILEGAPGAVWSGPRQQAWMDTIGSDTIRMSEPEADRHLKRKALTFIRSRPDAFMHACIDRQMRFWAVAPSAQVYGTGIRGAVMIWTIPFWVLAGAALLRRPAWRWSAIVPITVAAGLAAVHVVYWTDIRMRAPIVPTLSILAALGAISIRSEFERRV